MPKTVGKCAQDGEIRKYICENRCIKVNNPPKYCVIKPKVRGNEGSIPPVLTQSVFFSIINPTILPCDIYKEGRAVF
jgi:hypothetical protein